MSRLVSSFPGNVTFPQQNSLGHSSWCWACGWCLGFALFECCPGGVFNKFAGIGITSWCVHFWSKPPDLLVGQTIFARAAWTHKDHDPHAKHAYCNDGQDLWSHLWVGHGGFSVPFHWELAADGGRASGATHFADVGRALDGLLHLLAVDLQKEERAFWEQWHRKPASCFAAQLELSCYAQRAATKRFRFERSHDQSWYRWQTHRSLPLCWSSL